MTASRTEAAAESPEALKYVNTVALLHVKIVCVSTTTVRIFACLPHSKLVIAIRRP